MTYTLQQIQVDKFFQKVFLHEESKRIRQIYFLIYE